VRAFTRSERLLVRTPVCRASVALLASIGVFLAASMLDSQEQQEHERPGWPCVPGHAVDPAYVEVTEATGGLLFLLQPGEAAQVGSIVGATHSYPQTLARVLGELRGEQELRVPVDGTVDGLYIAASLQCRQRIVVMRPDGVAVTIANAAEDDELQAGRLIRIEAPPPGEWRVILAGQGLYTVSVLAASRLGMAVSVTAPAGPDAEGARQSRPSERSTTGVEIEVSLTMPLAHGHVVLLDAGGEPLRALPLPEPEGGTYRLRITPPATRFRVSVEGTDADGWPVHRVHPILFGVRRDGDP
jgi:hypothetical protein